MPWKCGDDSFVNPAFIALLRRHGVAWVVATHLDPWPLFEDVTADFIYMRLHGSTELYQQPLHQRGAGSVGGSHPRLVDGQATGGRAADLEGETAPGALSRDVYCYFDNTDKLHAPDNARELMASLGLPL